MVEKVTLAKEQSPKAQPIPNFPKAKLVERIEISEDLMIIKVGAGVWTP